MKKLRIAFALLGAVAAIGAQQAAGAGAASFEITGFDGGAIDRTGMTETQAGASPWQISSRIDFSTRLQYAANYGRDVPVPAEQPRDMVGTLPAGWLVPPQRFPPAPWRTSAMVWAIARSSRRSA